MDDRFEEFYAKVEKYGGWKQVLADRIHAIFEEITEPSAKGFIAAKRGYFAHKIDGDITHVIKLEALKGASYGLAYGASLSYVPYPYTPKLKWHRTLKSIWLDLSERPQIHQVPGDGARNARSYLASALLGEACFREDLGSAWRGAAAGIAAWFQATSTLEGVLARCGEHLSRVETGVRYLPGARLVRAFTLAKVGRTQEARDELKVFLSEYQEGAEARANLTSAIEGINSK